MNRFNVPTQLDIIDYMLSQSGEVPMLDRSLTSNDITDQQLHVAGIDAPYVTDDTDEFDEAKLAASNNSSRRYVM